MSRRADAPFDRSVLTGPIDPDRDPFKGRWLRLPPQPRHPRGEHREDFEFFSQSLGYVEGGFEFVGIVGLLFFLFGFGLLFEGSASAVVGGIASMAAAVAGLVAKFSRSGTPSQAALSFYSDGAIVPGIVERIDHQSTVGGGRGHCQLTCRFWAGSDTFEETSFWVFGADAALVRVGDVVPVFYLPGFPKAATLAVIPPAPPTLGLDTDDKD